MMEDRSRSISTSMAFTRRSACVTCSASSALNSAKAYTAVRICDSTNPPISMTREDTSLSSLSNWLERCLSTMAFIPFIQLTESSRDVVFGFLPLGLEEHLFGGTKFHQIPEVHIGRVVAATRRLLHVVRDDDHGVIALELDNQFLHLGGRNRIQC